MIWPLARWNESSSTVAVSRLSCNEAAAAARNRGSKGIRWLNIVCSCRKRGTRKVADVFTLWDYICRGTDLQCEMWHEHTMADLRGVSGFDTSEIEEFPHRPLACG